MNRLREIRAESTAPNVEEAQGSDVGGVSMIDEASQLPSGQLEGKQLVQEAECCGDNPACCHTPDLHVMRENHILKEVIKTHFLGNKASAC